VLWQVAPNFPLDLERLRRFLELLPKTTVEAAELAQRHHEKIEGDAWTRAEVDRPLRHAIEPRHPSFYVPEVIGLLRSHGVALVVADAADRYPSAEDVTADFMYLRLHGIGEIYADGYTDDALEWWAARIRAWTRGDEPKDARRIVGHRAPQANRREAFVYFDNDAKARAPFDAMRLLEKLGIRRASAPAPEAPTRTKGKSR
jgi:uncharacterized protein YecE (DUF72 family)